jgi:hypothetical protein
MIITGLLILSILLQVLQSWPAVAVEAISTL